MNNEIIFLLSCLTTAALTLGSLIFGAYGLLAAICLQGILENIFVVKQIQLFGLHVTASDVFAVGLVFALNLLQEFYGKDLSRKAIHLYFLTSIWFLLARTAHVLYEPSIYDFSQEHFIKILESSPRLILASLTTSLFSLHLDRYCYSKIKSLLTNKLSWLSNLASIALSQLFDTILFTYLALYGNVASPTNIIIVSYSVKLMAISLTGPFAMLARPIFKITQIKS